MEAPEAMIRPGVGCIERVLVSQIPGCLGDRRRVGSELDIYLSVFLPDE